MFKKLVENVEERIQKKWRQDRNSKEDLVFGKNFLNISQEGRRRRFEISLSSDLRTQILTDPTQSIRRTTNRYRKGFLSTHLLEPFRVNRSAESPDRRENRGTTDGAYGPGARHKREESEGLFGGFNQSALPIVVREKSAGCWFD